jgi:hypothetical protein
MSSLILKAETVLQDCKHSIWAYDINLQAEELRIKWVSIISLLRAVGHVLLKVDTTKDEKLKKIIICKFKEIDRQKEQNMIYHEFIKKERDRFLKEYDHGFIRLVGPKPGIRKGVYSSFDVSRNRGAVVEPRESDEIVSYLSSGPYQGKYERDIAKMAYEWWQEVIDDIKHRYDSP